MNKKEERVKLGLGIFCSVCILTMTYILFNSNPEELLTDLNQVEKNVNVVFSKDEEINQIIVEPYSVIDFENIIVEKNTVKDYTITFDNKTGYVDYIFYIENKSPRTAVLEEYELPTPVCKGFQEDCEKALLNLSYQLRYEDDSPVTAGDIIGGRSKQKVKLTIKYTANENNLPSASFDITNLGFTLNFKAK